MEWYSVRPPPDNRMTRMNETRLNNPSTPQDNKYHKKQKHYQEKSDFLQFRFICLELFSNQLQSLLKRKKRKERKKRKKVDRLNCTAPQMIPRPQMIPDRK